MINASEFYTIRYNSTIHIIYKGKFIGVYPEDMPLINIVSTLVKKAA